MDRKNPKIASIAHFPKLLRDNIDIIRDLIVEQFHPEMIILFGSLAAKKWTWKSDIDVLIVADTNGRPHLELDIKDCISDRLHKKVAPLFSPVVVSPEQLNDKLAVGHYFFSEIVDKGMLLYNTGRFSLAEMRPLEKEEYLELVKKDFKNWREEAEGFLRLYQSAITENLPKHAAFNLHQVVECTAVMVELVYTRYRSKIHDLKELMRRIISCISETVNVFPKDTEFQKQAYHRLYIAYVAARYDENYVIEDEELKYLGERVKLLLELTIKSCEEKINRLLDDEKNHTMEGSWWNELVVKW